jgi:hypothetical protein
VPPADRAFILNCALLAQLAANKQVPSGESVGAWYAAYFDTLTRLGWTAEQQGFSEHTHLSADFETTEAILAVATVLLGGAPSALAIVTSTLNAMKTMSDGRWMTIFKRESQRANVARFQVGVAESKKKGAPTVSLMAFELNAKSTLTQVLFFKYKANEVTLRHASGRVAIDPIFSSTLATAISQKVVEYARDFIAAVPI